MDDLLPLPADPRLPSDRPFTTAGARAAGVPDDRLRRLCRDGQLRRVLRGVYADAGAPNDLLTRSMALSMVVPADAVVTDETAGWLHGAQVLPAADHLVLPPIKVFRLPGGTRVRRPEARGGERTLVARDLQRVHGVLVTTPLRTALDLGRLAPRDRAFSSLDSLMSVDDFDLHDIERELPRFRGARGVVQLRTLAPLANALAASPGESVLRLRWLDAGLPAPELQVPLRDDSGIVRYYGDLGLPALRFLAEYDGREHHTSPADRAHDEQRRDWLRRRGWVVVVLTREEVFGSRERAGDLLRRGIAEARMRQLRRAS